MQDFWVKKKAEREREKSEKWSPLYKLVDSVTTPPLIKRSVSANQKQALYSNSLKVTEFKQLNTYRALSLLVFFVVHYHEN